MKRIKITVIRQADYKDLKVGQIFFSEGLKKPEGLCDSAWETMLPFAMTLAYGGTDIYNGWMKNKNTAMISCNDGFRPVSFYLEALDEETDDNQSRDN